MKIILLFFFTYCILKLIISLYNNYSNKKNITKRKINKIEDNMMK